MYYCYNSSLTCKQEGCVITHYFKCLQDVITNPRLNEEEKFTLLWLFAHQNPNKMPPSCSFSFGQLAEKMNKSAAKIRHIIDELRSLGGIFTDAPLALGEFREEMAEKVYNFRIAMPPIPQPEPKEEATVLPYHETRPPICFDLSNERFLAQMPKMKVAKRKKEDVDS
jgi:hypothetical protein